MKNVVYYDIETDEGFQLQRKGFKVTVQEKGTITSFAFKVNNGKTKCYTIGYNVESEADLLKAIKPLFENKNNILVAWNGNGFDDVIMRNTFKDQVKCKFFDLMQGYNKFILGKSGFTSLNVVGATIGESKANVNPIHAWNNKEFETLYKYNIIDVDLLAEIDNKYNIISDMHTILKTTGLKYPNSIFGVTKPLESYINKNGISIHTNKRNNLTNYGGLNYYKHKGRHDNLKHYDVNSLYPSLFLCLNASSNLNYHQIKKYTIDNVDGLEKYGNIYFNETGTLQVKKVNGEFVAIELTKPLNVKAGNGDIAKLTSQLLTFKQNNTGALRSAYKILINGLYGALDSKYFSYTHKNLSSACTFFGRLLLYRCIREFKGLYAKTDSVWVPTNVTADDLNRFSAEVLNECGLFTFDGDEPLIKWELEAEPELLYIKDFNNYIEKINGNYSYRGSFIIPAQKELIANILDNPDLDYTEWVKTHLNDIPLWCEYSKLSERQTNHWKQNTILSDKLGLPYTLGFKVYRYFSNDGWVNTEIINDKCPEVNLDYALNRASKILKQYGFIKHEHRFRDDKPKKTTKNTPIQLGQTTLNSPSFKTLNDVITAIYEPIVGNSSGNNLNMAMVGTAYRLGYDVRPAIDKVRRELGSTSASELTYNIPLKAEGYGLPTLKEEVGDEELVNEYIRLLTTDLKPIKTGGLNLDKLKVEYEDIRGKIITLANQHEIVGVTKIFGIKEFNLHFYQKEIYVYFNDKNEALLYTNYNEFIDLVKSKLIGAFNYNLDPADKEAVKKHKRHKYIHEQLNPFIHDLNKLHREHEANLINKAPLLNYTELRDLFIKVFPNFQFKEIHEIDSVLTILLTLGTPIRALLELIKPSGGGGGAITRIAEKIYNNIVIIDECTKAGFVNECIDNPNYFDGQTVYFKDLGGNSPEQNVALIDGALKPVVSDKMHKTRKSSNTDSNSSEVVNINTNKGFKALWVSTHPIVINNQIEARKIKITYQPAHLTHKEIIQFRRNKKDEKPLDLNIFKLILFRFLRDTQQTLLTEEEELKILDYLEEVEGVNINNKHTTVYVDNQEQLKGYLGDENYYKLIFKPKFIDRVSEQDAIELYKILKDFITPLELENFSLKDCNIAKAKTSIRGHKKGFFNAFTITAIKGISNPWVKANQVFISQWLQTLLRLGYVENTGEKTRDGKNIYILYDVEVQ